MCLRGPAAHGLLGVRSDAVRRRLVAATGAVPTAEHRARRCHWP